MHTVSVRYKQDSRYLNSFYTSDLDSLFNLCWMLNQNKDVLYFKVIGIDSTYTASNFGWGNMEKWVTALFLDHNE